MAVITNPLIQALNTIWRKDFQNGIDAIDPSWKEIATEIPSTTKSNTYGWIGEMPSMVEWVGDRVLSDIKEHGYSILNKSWANGVTVLRTDIEDDEVGMYSMRMKDLGEESARQPDKIVWKALRDGEAELCFDGQNFFDTDHPVYENHDQTGVMTAVSNLQAGLEPPFYLLNTSRTLKPLIFQNRKKPELVEMQENKDEEVFMRNKLRFGADSRNNVGYGFWQMAYKSKAGLTEANLNAAIEAMTTIKMDGGDYLDNEPTVLIVPPSLRAVANELVLAQYKANGGTNPLYNIVKVMVTARVA